MGQLQHPVLGTLEVPDRLLEPENREELEQNLLQMAADTLPQDEAWYETFTKQFGRTASETARGVADLTGMETPENDYTIEFVRRARAIQNPNSAFAGELAGAIGDVPSYLFGGVARKGAGLLEQGIERGMSVGGISGALMPVYDMFGDDRIDNATVGATLGGVLGGAGGAVLKRLGYKTEEELAEAMRRSTPEEQAQIESVMQEEVLRLESPEAMDARKAAEEQPMFSDQPEEVQRAQINKMKEAWQKEIDELDLSTPVGQDRLAKLKAEFQDSVDEAFQLERQQAEEAIRRETLKMEDEVMNLPSKGAIDAAAKTVKSTEGKVNALDVNINKLRTDLSKVKNAKMPRKIQSQKIQEAQARLDAAVTQRNAADAERRAASAVTDAYKQGIETRRQLTNWRERGEVPTRIKALEFKQPATRKEGVKRQPLPRGATAIPPQLTGGTSVARSKIPKTQNNRDLIPEQPIPEVAMGRQEAPVYGVGETTTIPRPPRQIEMKATEQPSQPVSAAPSATQEGVAKASPEAVEPAPTTVAKDQGKVGQFTDKLLGSVSTRLKNISEAIAGRMRRYEFDVESGSQDKLSRVESFMRMDNKLAPTVRDDLNLALMNGEFGKAMKLMTPEMRKEFVAVRKMLKDTYKELKDAGIDFPALDNYFPRKVKDYDALLNAMGREKRGVFTEALNVYAKKNTGGNVEAIPADIRSDIIDQVVRGVFRKGDTAVMPNAKQRTISQVPSELLPFYENASTALSYYIRNTQQTIAKAKFFGRTLNKTSTGNVDVEKSIGNFIESEVVNKQLSAQQEKQLLDMLRARFIEGELSPNNFISVVRDTGYAGTIANYISALTQLGDLGTSGALHGLSNTIGAMFNTKNYKAIDLGIDHTIAHELQNERATSKALNKLFGLSGFRMIDRLGKETIINAAMRKNEKLVKSAEGEAAFRKKWSGIFGDEIDSVITDLRQGNMTDNTKFLAFNEIADVQPIALSEMPEAYLKSPNGRIFYMLKSFTLKQIDLVRRNIVQEAKQGNVDNAIKNAVLLGGYLMAANTGTQAVKDMLLGREVRTEDLPDRAVWSVLSVFGINQYITDRYLAQGDIMGAVGATVTPATPVANLAKDVYKQGKAIVEGDEVNLFKATKSIPLVGPIVYSWLGGGKENFNDRLED
jgi:hypothetical protein